MNAVWTLFVYFILNKLLCLHYKGQTSAQAKTFVPFIQVFALWFLLYRGFCIKDLSRKRQRLQFLSALDSFYFREAKLNFDSSVYCFLSLYSFKSKAILGQSLGQVMVDIDKQNITRKLLLFSN